jgi:hypothetical protein
LPAARWTSKAIDFCRSAPLNLKAMRIIMYDEASYRPALVRALCGLLGQHLCLHRMPTSHYRPAMVVVCRVTICAYEPRKVVIRQRRAIAGGLERLVRVICNRFCFSRIPTKSAPRLRQAVREGIVAFTKKKPEQETSKLTRSGRLLCNSNLPQLLRGANEFFTKMRG